MPRRRNRDQLTEAEIEALRRAAAVLHDEITRVQSRVKPFGDTYRRLLAIQDSITAAIGDDDRAQPAPASRLWLGVKAER